MKTQLQRPLTAVAPRRMKLGSVSSGVTVEPPRVLIYGVGGVGKSTFASESPSPIILDTQDGTGRLGVDRFPRPNTFQDVLDAIDELLAEDHQYKTLVVDLLDDVESLIWQHICARDGESSIEGYGYGKGYKVALNEWRLLVSRLERLRREKRMGVIFVAHSAVKPYKNPEGDDFDRHGLQLHDQAGGLIRGWCDTVLFARHEMVIKTDQKRRTRGISTGARVIQTVETAGYYAKNRDGLPDTLPLDYAAFAQAVSAGQPADPEAIRSEIDELSARIDDATRLRVEQAVAVAGEDSVKLSKILNRLREIQPSGASNE